MLISDALVEMVGGDGKSNAGGTHYYNPGSEIELACVVRNRYGQKLNYFLSCQFPSHLPEIKEKLNLQFFSFRYPFYAKFYPAFYWLKLILGQ